MKNSIPRRKKILISAYAISPYMGSEYGVGWNFVTKLNAFYDITVLYGTSGGVMGNNSEMLSYVEKNGSNGINYVYVRPNSIVLFLDWLNRKINPIFFSYSYMLWQRQVLAAARKLSADEDYAIAHQLNTIGFRNPGFLWKLNIPFVWGPIGGTSNLNKIFFPLLSRGNYLRHLIRNWSNAYFLRFSPRVKRASKKASAIFCATKADNNNFKRFLNVEGPVLRENSIINQMQTIKKTEKHLNFVWVGRIDDLKALNLLITAIAKLNTSENWTLHVVGDGPAKNKCVLMSEELGIAERIVWHGTVERQRVLEIMQDSDVNIITSLMDSNPTVLLEAFEMCIPTIALDHFGMSDLIDADTGFKIKITTLDDILRKMTEKLEFCLNRPDVLDRMKSCILERQRELHWDVTIHKVQELYERVLVND